MASTNDLWIQITAETEEQEDTALVDVAAARELIRNHNESDSAHEDIRERLQEIADTQTQEIKEYASKRNFPSSGDTSVTIYVDVSTGNLYRFNTSSRQYETLAMDTIPDSIALDGVPTAPTARIGTNTSQIATTAFVQTELAALREQTEAVTPVYYDSRTKAKLSLLGENGTIVTNVANGKVEQGSSDAITGGQLWSAQQDFANMTALAARNIAANAAEIDLLKQAGAVRTDITGTNITVNRITEGDTNTFTLTAVAEGVAEPGNTGLINGDTLRIAIDEAESYFTAGDGIKIEDGTVSIDDTVATKADLEQAAFGSQFKIINGDHTAAMLGETDGQSTYAINVRANGRIQQNDGRIITGATVYEEVRLDQDGHVILENNTAAQNLEALDNALFEIRNSIDGISDATSLGEAIENLGSDLNELRETVNEQAATINELDEAKADTNLANLTEDGLNVIRQLVEDNEYRIINGDHTTATLGEEDGVPTYAINVRATGAIALHDGRIVTGQTVYNEVRPEDGNYISSDYTTGLNLSNLDTQLKTTVDATYALAETVEQYDDAIADNTALVNEIAERIETIYTKEEADEKFAEKADSLAGYGIVDVYTKDESDAAINSAIANKADVDDVYTKTEVNELFNEKANASDVYAKDEADTVFATKTELEEKANADNVYTKDETDERLATITENIVTIDAQQAELSERFTELAENISDMSYSAGEYVKISDNNVISVKVLGNVQEGSVGIVTGDKIARAITDSEVRTGTFIQNVHDELTYRIENLERTESEYAYTLVKNDETNQLILLSGDNVISRVQLAIDTDTRYSLEKVGNTIRLIPNDDPTQAIPIELDPDVNTTYTLSLEDNRLIFTANDDTDPVVIELPETDLTDHEERITALEEREIENTEYVAGDGITIDEDNIISVDNRVIYRVESENGNESRVYNGADGSNLTFVNMEKNIASSVEVKDGSDDIGVQIYSVDYSSNFGSRINVNSYGAYYNVGEHAVFTVEDEIITRKDLADANSVDVFGSKEDFPQQGIDGKLYIDAEHNVPYRWNPDTGNYVEVSGNKNIDSLTDEEIDSLF